MVAEERQQVEKHYFFLIPFVQQKKSFIMLAFSVSSE